MLLAVNANALFMEPCNGWTKCVRTLLMLESGPREMTLGPRSDWSAGPNSLRGPTAPLACAQILDYQSVTAHYSTQLFQ